MDDTELHYLAYDPEAILRDMMKAYVDAGGDPLYPGDEKEMFLQAVLQIVIQAFAGIDNALRMDTLRYAVRDYLDIYGEKRNCARIPAQAATARVKITMEATGTPGTIAAGTAFTVDGAVMYATKEDVAVGGFAQELIVDVECTQKGSIGNGLIAGMEMQTLVPIDGALTFACVTSASGGQDRESDEAYRERIRAYGLASVTTGAASLYESQTLAVSSQILDARALNDGDGEVGVYVILEDGAEAESIIPGVTRALSAETARPLTDHVTVYEAEEEAYTLLVKVWYNQYTSVGGEVLKAIEEYQAWQDNRIGRAFNPDKLMAMLYQAGCERVVYLEGSGMEDAEGPEYTEIAERARCKGTITLTVVNT